MKTSQRLLLGRIVVIAICSQGIASAQSSPEAQRAVVVKLRIVLGNGVNDTAAGLFVGKDRQNAYFITANHAVGPIGPDFKRIPARSIQLQFRGSPQNFSASVLENYDEELDLGVVSTAVANLPPGLPKTVKKDVAVGSPIYILGHPPGGFWSVWPGNIQNENAPSGDVQHFITNRDGSLTGGYSGGPVVDSDGDFLGMHISTKTGYGVAAKSSDIVRHLDAWQVPTNNLTEFVASTPPTPPPVQRDVDAIKKVLGVYEDAYNRKDTNALSRIWPGIPSSTRGAIENAFGSARSIRVKLQLDDPVFESGDTSATVTGQFSEVFTPKNGNVQTTPNESISFILKKNDGAWTIVDVK
jgi:hypothetical protein